MKYLTYEELQELIQVVESVRDKELESKNKLIQSLKDTAASWEDNKTVKTCQERWQFRPPPLYTWEGNHGEMWTGHGPMYTTGIILNWEETKQSVINNGGDTSALSTVGYFYNPAGIMCTAGRFKYYAGLESSGWPLGKPSRIEYLKDGTPVCFSIKTPVSG